MDTMSRPAAENDVPQSARGRPSRLFFVDHLRAALAVLVVLHHVAIIYGAVLPTFYYLEPPFISPGVIDTTAYTTLLVFALFNQGWFMGAFFLFAGYFTPGSFDRKGTGAFIKDRIVRLGIPLALFSFVLNPLSWLGLWLMPEYLTAGLLPELTWEQYPKRIGMGPLWFVALLLVFSLGYVVWRVLMRSRPVSRRSGASRPSLLGIAIFALALAGASYLIRMLVPIGESVGDFPTIAYLPQYLGFFVVGAVASRRDWLRTVPTWMGVSGFVAAVLAAVLLFPLAFSGSMFSLELTAELENAWGDGSWQSAVYALWDSVFAVGTCLGAIVLFRRFFDTQGRLGRFLSRQSYAVFFIHIPVLVVLAWALGGITLAPLLKFALAAVVAVPACFAVAYLVRKIPGLGKVL
jgi:glucan biosynthesis protein C